MSPSARRGLIALTVPLILTGGLLVVVQAHRPSVRPDVRPDVRPRQASKSGRYINVGGEWVPELGANEVPKVFQDVIDDLRRMDEADDPRVKPPAFRDPWKD